MGHVGGPYKSPNSPKVEPEKTFNFDDDVGNLELDHTMTRMDGDGGAIGESCQALLCPGVSSPSVREGVQGQA